MRLSQQRMYEHMLASDSTCDGRFFTGVLTTGIYCLPSCRARKPRRENVRFFPSSDAARAAGLRPCLKCHPDDFARGADPVLESVETLVGEIRQCPASFPDAQTIVRRSGFGATRLFELFRRHYHASPADVLLRARLEHARTLLLTGSDGLVDIAHTCGFDSLSTFHDQFRRTSGLTPAGYRRLSKATAFSVALPEGYPLGYLRRALGRDPHASSERFADDTYTAVFRTGSAVVQLTLELERTSVRVRCRAGQGPAAHAATVRLLGLDQPALAFARLVRKHGLTRLIAGRAELRISLTPSVYESLLWAIIGQQINFPFACTLKRRLYDLVGEPAGDGLIAPPTPASIAALAVSDLTPHQFSASKAAYLIETSRLVAQGTVDLEGLRLMSATRVERTLLAIRGLGPWSVNYIMMRGLGFADCVPLGDTGVSSGLQHLLRLDQRPDADSTRRHMALFSPYRSLATAHLWQLRQPLP